MTALPVSGHLNLAALAAHFSDDQLTESMGRSLLSNRTTMAAIVYGGLFIEVGTLWRYSAGFLGLL